MLQDAAFTLFPQSPGNRLCIVKRDENVKCEQIN